MPAAECTKNPAQAVIAWAGCVGFWIIQAIPRELPFAERVSNRRLYGQGGKDGNEQPVP